MGKLVAVLPTLNRYLTTSTTTATQATIWEAYRRMGIDPGLTAHGRLLAEMPDIPVTANTARAAAE